MRESPHNPQHVLKGFSGCSLEVFRNCSGNFVRKTAGTRDQNDKMQAESEKLVRLARIGQETNLFTVPAIRECGVTPEGLAFYELDFVPAWELDARLPQLPPREIDDMAGRIYEIINVFAKLSPLAGAGAGEDERGFILGKFRETAEALCRDQSRPQSAQYLVDEYCEKVASLEIPADVDLGKHTFCHGDLALDNVLIGRSGTIHLIDPLINGHESYLWDIAKVFQSSLMRWRQIKYGEFAIDHERRKVHLSASMRVAFFNVRFALLVTDDYCPRVVTLYLAATLARAAKYSKTTDQLCALLILTNELLDRFVREECDLDESLSSMRW